MVKVQSRDHPSVYRHAVCTPNSTAVEPKLLVELLRLSPSSLSVAVKQSELDHSCMCDLITKATEVFFKKGAAHVSNHG